MKPIGGCPKRALRFGVSITAGVLVFVGLLAFVWPKPIVRILASVNPDVLFFSESDRPTVALTLDDGPHPETTPAILDLLSRHDANATFFLIGERADSLGHIVERIRAEGHEIGNHGMRDEPAVCLSRDELQRSIDSTAARVGRPGTRWYRPGAGIYDEEVLEVSRSRGLQVVLGSVYPFDTVIESPAYASWFILRNAEPGSIIVLHDHGENGRRTVKTLKRVLPALARRGLQVVTLGELVAIDGAD